jgi:DNA-binding transcriptional regulator YbjK
MPKVVDPDARRRHVVEALFRVVVRDGLQRASLRVVADEAALNIGSVRHYFIDQQELMRFAMTSMLERVAARITAQVARLGQVDSRSRQEKVDIAVNVLSELLPLDQQRRSEVTVFLDFVTAARTNPAFADLARDSAAGVRQLIQRILARLGPQGDLDLETERLTALIDGLSLNGVLQPDLLPPATATAVLRRHLNEISRPSAEDR